MPENRKPSALRVKYFLFALFYILLLTLAWRLIDFFDEVISGATKMSLGSFGLEGYDALVAQSVIICTLLLLVYKVRKWHTHCDLGR